MLSCMEQEPGDSDQSVFRSKDATLNKRAAKSKSFKSLKVSR